MQTHAFAALANWTKYRACVSPPRSESPPKDPNALLGFPKLDHVIFNSTVFSFSVMVAALRCWYHTPRYSVIPSYPLRYVLLFVVAEVVAIRFSLVLKRALRSGDAVLPYPTTEAPSAESLCEEALVEDEGEENHGKVQYPYIAVDTTFISPKFVSPMFDSSL